MRKIIYLILIATVFNSCEEAAELSPKNYPVVFMDCVQVTETGVEFTASVRAWENTPVTRYGFVWSEGDVLDSLNMYTTFFEQPMEASGYTLRVTSDILQDRRYSVRPVVYGNATMVIGNQLVFTGEGSAEPVITGFYPKSGDSGDIITLSGENFTAAVSRAKVFLGDDPAEVIYASQNELRFVVPENITRAGKVSVRLQSGESQVTATEKFTILGHAIQTVSPASGYIGETELTITGEKFMPSGNSVRIGGFDAEILQESTTQLRVRLPFTMNAGSAVAEVNSNGKWATSPNPILILSRWQKHGDFPADARAYGYMGRHGNKGILIGGSTEPICCNQDFSDVWMYDFTTDTWQESTEFPGTPRSMAAGFQIGGKIYYGLGGHNFGRLADFWSFDIATETWTQLGDFPGRPRYDLVYFTLNDRGYVIGGSVGISDSREVWEYQPGGDTWTRLGNIYSDVAHIIDGRDVFLQNEDRAFFLPVTFSSDGILYEFNPGISGFLSPVTTVPFKFRQEGRFMSFVIGNTLYIGGDDYHNTTYEENPDFWTYNLVTGHWKRIESDLAGEREGVNTVVYDGTAYTFFGVDSRCCSSANKNYHDDVWSYNPDR